jgi:hypothetical protein
MPASTPRNVPLFFSAAVVALFFARTVGASRTA